MSIPPPRLPVEEPERQMRQYVVIRKSRITDYMDHERIDIDTGPLAAIKQLLDSGIWYESATEQEPKLVSSVDGVSCYLTQMYMYLVVLVGTK